jgi:hypothetical protein
MVVAVLPPCLDLYPGMRKASEPVPATQVLQPQSGCGLPQKPNDLLFQKNRYFTRRISSFHWIEL